MGIKMNIFKKIKCIKMNNIISLAIKVGSKKFGYQKAYKILVKSISMEFSLKIFVYLFLMENMFY